MPGRTRINPIGFVRTGGGGCDGNHGCLPVLGEISSIFNICRDNSVGEIYVTDGDRSLGDIVEIADICSGSGATVRVSLNHGSMLRDLLPAASLNGFKLVNLSGARNMTLYNIVKRVFDFVATIVLLLLTSPLLLVSAFLIKWTSKGPIIYRQRRIGKEGKEFPFFKFRTMYVDNDDSIHREYLKNLIKKGDGPSSQKKVYKIEKDPRVTPVGRTLRKWSVDELPQLFNILRGEMSLVGPRPPIRYETDHYRSWHWQRQSVLPGITGLWQVNGRSRVKFDEMVFMDIYYVKNRSLLLDLKILFKTVPVVLSTKGAY